MYSRAKGLTSSPFVWKLSQTVFQREQAFSIFAKFPATLGEDVRASEMAMAIGDVVSRRSTTGTQETQAEKVTRILIAVV